MPVVVYAKLPQFYSTNNDWYNCGVLAETIVTMVCFRRGRLNTEINY